MRQTTSTFVLSFLFVLSAFTPIAGQSQIFTDDNVAYQLELPSPTWKVVTRPDGLQRRTEIIYGDRLDGYLQISKETVETGITAETLANTFEDEKLRFRPGYVDGKEEKFAGRLNGLTVSYVSTSCRDQNYHIC